MRRVLISRGGLLAGLRRSPSVLPLNSNSFRCLSAEGASLQKAFLRSVKPSPAKEEFKPRSSSGSSSSGSGSPTPIDAPATAASLLPEPSLSPANSISSSSSINSSSSSSEAVPKPLDIPAARHLFAQPTNLQEFAPRICVVGVGGGGCNAINNMVARGLSGVEFICLNTDAQHLATTLTEKRIQIGRTTTQGLGCGANPDVGRAAAEESRAEIAEMIGDAHMVFITAGMGGGTGTGAAPVVAEVCMERGILTVAVVTKPFSFEGRHRNRLAMEGMRALQDRTDTLIVIPNQNLFKVIPFPRPSVPLSPPNPSPPPSVTPSPPSPFPPPQMIDQSTTVMNAFGAGLPLFPPTPSPISSSPPHSFPPN